MSTLVGHGPARLLAAVLFVAALVCSAGPGGTGASAQADLATPSCIVPHGAGPGYNASIGNAQNGKTVCIAVGEKLLVVLSAGSPNGSPWRAVHVSRPGVLKVAPLTLMLSRGLTATNFQGVRPGTVRLTSERSPCTPTSLAVHCNVVEMWQATVVVRQAVPV